MSKTFANSSRPAKIGNQRFTDPLAFATANAKATAPVSIWTLNPEQESFDHINIHSDSHHPLGRWFNPRATQTFPMGSFGTFNTIEAYMYFLLANSMRITEPDIVARVDTLRQASSVMLGVATAQLPNDLRQAYAHTYRLPDDVYKNIIGYVADAYMSKIHEIALAENQPDILETAVVKDILSNRLPYFGYYISNDITMNVSQRVTIISAIKVIEYRLREMMAVRKKVDASPMKAALLKAGIKTNNDRTALIAPEHGFQFPKTVTQDIPLGLTLADHPVDTATLEQFREDSEIELHDAAETVEPVQETENVTVYHHDGMAYIGE